jgi:predicted dehydrogenase
LWLGTAPEREFVPKIYHVNKWRAWQDFGTGWSGDIGCHIFDAVWKGLGLTAPISVSAKVQELWKTSPARRGETWPQSNHITWIFPGNKLSDGKEIPVEWFDGEFYPDEEAQAFAREAGHAKGVPEEAALVIGTEGAILIPHTQGPVLVPKAKFAEVQRPNIKERRNHYHHFLDTILGKAKCESQFAQTGPMAEAIILGTVAVRTPDTLLKWDAANLKTDSEVANKLLRRTYRSGWEFAL